MRYLAIPLALISAFFAFYTARLLAVTQFLQHTRVGGGGAFIGAIIFPLISIVCGWGAVRAWRRGQ